MAERVSIPKPTYSIEADQIHTHLVDLDKVEIYVASSTYTNIFMLFFGTFSGAALGRLTEGKKDDVFWLLGIITLVFGVLIGVSLKKQGDSFKRLKQENIRIEQTNEKQ